jgi:Flp pilus assembly protein protease CpaA
MLNLLQTPGAAPVRLLLLAALLLATATDLHRRRIPNLLTLPTALAAVVLHGAYGGLAAAGASLLSLLGWFGLGFFYYRTLAGKEIGAGDIKLVMALAAGLGFLPAAYVTCLSLALLLLWLFLRWFVQGTARANFTGLLRWIYVSALPGVEKVHFRPVGMVDQTPHAPFLLLSAVLCDYLYHAGHLGR